MNSIILLSTLAFTSTAPVPEGNLKWKLEKGDVFYTKAVTKTDQTIKVRGQEVPQKQTQTVYSKFTIVSADEKGYVIEQLTEKQVSDGSIPGDIAKKMEGVKLTFTTDKKFNVKKVEGFDDMIEKLVGDNELAKKTVKSMMSEETMKMSLFEMFGFSPDKPVKSGDSWNSKQKYPLGPLGEFTLDRDMKLKTVDDLDKITYSATVKFSLGGGEEGGAFKITGGELKSDSWKGEYVFDSKKGRLVSSKMAAKTSGNMKMSVQNMEIEMELTQDIKTELTVSDKSLIKKKTEDD